MKDEYIKKMDITQRVLAITGEWKDGPEFWIPIDQVLGNIALLPAEDVAPVRHAKWLSKAMRIMCSDCGAEFNDEIMYMLNNYEPMNYCPSCGAKMDGGDGSGR